MKYFWVLFIGLWLLIPQTTSARDYISEWYIKDMQTTIDIQPDGSLDIEEKIAADCGDLPEKHGIYRVIPTTKYLTADEVIEYDVELTSITNERGVSYNYSESTDSYNDTLTWKIGDPDITVNGVNIYVIKYHVTNVIQGNNPDFDEFYWNVHGQFWDMEADKVKAIVNFPENFDYTKQETNLYSGSFGENTNIASYNWPSKNTIEVTSNRTLSKNEGLTLSVTMPKGMTQTAVVKTIDRRWAYALAAFWFVLQFIWIFVIPLVLLGAFYIWYRYGKDPSVNKTVIAQYEPPLKLNPMQLGLLMNNGSLTGRHITASIVNLAVKKVMKIEEIPKKGWFDSKDFSMTLLKDKGSSEYLALDKSEQDLIDYIFGGSKTKLLSSLKNKFYTHIDSLKTTVRKEVMDDKKLFDPKGFEYGDWMWIILILCIVGGVFLMALLPVLAISLLGSAVILGIFAYLMPRLTPAGAEAKWAVNGFKLFMLTAEKYRQQFYEKEFIFEKFLPYAITFDIVKQWTKNMEAIYGVEKMRNYSPYWYTSSAMASGFDVNSFTSTLNSMSSNMSSTISSSPSSSGSHGGGFSGGGGGGGGGGGW